MSEVDIAEGLPNGDDSAFTEDHHHDGSGDASNHVVQTSDSSNAASQNAIPAEHVFVATSQGLLTAAEHFQGEGLKTTHIVIHDQTLTVDSVSGLKTPTTPLPPPTPATPLSREKGFKYTWDESVECEVLPVRCKNTNGELHKAKFGSGTSTSA